MKPQRIPSRPRAPAAKSTTVSLADVLERASKLATAGQLGKAVEMLGKVAGKIPVAEGKRPVTAPDLLVQLAGGLRLHHPAVAAQLAQEAVQIDPSLMTAWTLLAGLWDRIGELDKAKDACLKVAASAGSTPEQLLGTANLLVRYREDKAAIDTGRKAFEQLGKPLNWASSLLYIAMRVADWALVKELTEQLRDAYRHGKFAEARESPRTNLLWCDDEAMNIAVLKEWGAQTLPGEVGTPPPAKPLQGRRLRVGYLSSDFRDHPTSRLINGLFRHHDRGSLELFMYCSGWDDGSAMRKEVVSHFDHVHTVTSMSEEEGAALIRSHGIDVLVELNGPTRANRMGILKHRPAPVQIDYLGWPGSVGGRVVDYVVGDSYCVPPGAEQFYPEKVIRLHATYQVNDYAARSLPAPPTREQMGLPEGVPVIGMFNAINKVNGEVWAVWMRIMKAVPDSVLWILDPGPVGRRNIGKACVAHGVDSKRVIAASSVRQDAHLARLQLCDIMVDPWPYGGHTSTSDALFAGVPVVALAGTNFASRVSGGLLHAAGMGALVNDEVEGYIASAVKLLADRAELARVKSHIRANIGMTDIFDARKKARQLEAAYHDAYARASEGKLPRHMTFKPPASAAARVAPRLEKLPLVLVCGPWSSGTSAVAGMLAKAGLQAPGPYVAVNDPKTPATYEMLAFQRTLKQLAAEETLKLTASPADVLKRLRQFAEESLRPAWETTGGAAAGPVMLKHALTALMLPQICEVFDTRIVCVLRPLAAIEATRARRNWISSMGQAGARVVYAHIFDHIVNSGTPFSVVRYTELLASPAPVLDELASFCGLRMTGPKRAAALAFVSRPPAAQAAPAAVRA